MSQVINKQKIADTWAGQACTLNGKPATVLGRRQPFAVVSCCPDGERYEWAWETVDRIMSTTKAFRS